MESLVLLNGGVDVSTSSGIADFEERDEEESGILLREKKALERDGGEAP